jgi:hypothetical protein
MNRHEQKAASEGGNYLWENEKRKRRKSNEFDGDCGDFSYSFIKLARRCESDELYYTLVSDSWHNG